MVNRDNEELKRALAHHTNVGYPVTVPGLGPGTIANEGVEVREFVFFRVAADKPVPIQKYAQAKRWDTGQKKLEEFIQENPQHRVPPIIHGEIRDNLEAGGTASWAYIYEFDLLKRGCLDPEGNVICDDFHAGQLQMDSKRIWPGMIIVFHDHKMNKDFPGKVADVRDGIIYLEVFEPVPFMDAPEAIEPEKIRPGFYSDFTWKIGYGTYEAMQKKKFPIPKGNPVEDQEGRRQVPHYVLDEPVPLAMVQEFCQKHFKGQPHCLWQALMLFIIPINPSAVSQMHSGGTFVPLPLQEKEGLQIYGVTDQGEIVS